MSVDSSVPLEEQVREQIREAIARGEVVAGDPLPSVRQLAGDLGIHWNTVARAYRRLRDEGLLVVGRGRGKSLRCRVHEGWQVSLRHSRRDARAERYRPNRTSREARRDGG